LDIYPREQFPHIPRAQRAISHDIKVYKNGL
jgi:hypothetical protein